MKSGKEVPPVEIGAHEERRANGYLLIPFEVFHLYYFTQSLYTPMVDIICILILEKLRS